MTERVSVPLLFIILLPLAGALPAFAQPANLEGLTISDVEVVGNRTSRSLLESKILLKKGKPFHQADVEATRKNLYSMRLFKEVDITPRLDAQGRVDVTILAKDGWYVVPIPLAFSGAGGTGVTLDVLERNYLANNESVLLGAGQSNQGQSASFGAADGPWAGNAVFSRATFTQFAYADGGTNVSDMLGGNDLSDPGRYGPVSSTYVKEVSEGGGGVSFAPLSGLRLGVGFVSSKIDYPSPVAGGPKDSGWQNWGELTLALGSASRAGVNALSDSVGAVFGLGMADLNERVHPLAGPLWTWGSALSVDVANSALGSDYDFSRYRAAGETKLEFSDHNALEFRAVGAEGLNLPFTQEIATDHTLGLQGSYIREYLGNTGAGASLSGIYYFRRSLRGVLALQAFAETASVWGDGPGGRQSGVGGSLYYSFWRVPLPIGLGYTYSIPDRDGEISLAVGARFGG